jgi:hypothetical protein
MPHSTITRIPMTDSLIDLKDYSPEGIAITALGKLDALLLKRWAGDPRKVPEVFKRGDDAGEYDERFIFGDVTINRNSNERGDIAVTFYTEPFAAEEPYTGRLTLAAGMSRWLAAADHMRDPWARQFLIAMARELENTMGFVANEFILPAVSEETSKLITETCSIIGYFPMADGKVMEVHLDRNRYIPKVSTKPKYVPPGLRQGKRHRRG